MGVIVNTSIPIESDSDNTFPKDLEITLDDGNVVMRMASREIEVSFANLKQVMRIFAQVETEDSK